LEAIKPGSRNRQGSGDERRPARDAADPTGTNGVRLGISGEDRQVLLHGWLCSLAVVIGVVSMNVLTRRHDTPELGLLPPVIWEGSSALVTVVIILLPGLMMLWIRRVRPPLWIALLLHLLAALTYAVVHVAAFVALRKAAYALWMNGPYHFGPLAEGFFYEARKDVMVYAFAVAIFWVLARLRAAPAPFAATPEPVMPAMFDIRDGARLVRASIQDILAVRSAGNYAEFLLADGRRPLMRSSLSALETQLAGRGFLRTHRSWLVNPTRVTGLRPEGSGDYAIELGGVEAPLSRRFPQALAALRG
jgi:DNA-binding LytR/AlgR family response regulator